MGSTSRKERTGKLVPTGTEIGDHDACVNGTHGNGDVPLRRGFGSVGTAATASARVVRWRDFGLNDIACRTSVLTATVERASAPTTTAGISISTDAKASAKATGRASARTVSSW